MSKYVDIRVRVEIGGTEGDHCLTSLYSLIRRQCVTVGPHDSPFGVATVAAVLPFAEGDE